MEKQGLFSQPSFGVARSIDMLSQLLFSRSLAVGLAKLAPVVGLFVFVASVEAGGSSAWTDVWRVAMSVGLGIFITLVGAIYKNIERRMGEVEAAIRTSLLPRAEFEALYENINRALERIENKLEHRKG